MGGMPCTSVARTLLDLASVLSHRGIEAAVETAERLEIFDLRAVSLLLGRHRGKRGTATLRQILATFDDEVVRARSEAEALFFHLCVEHGIPRPRVNRFVDAGDERFEVDCHWPEPRLIVEIDSVFHDTTAARARDPRRDELLRRYGWTVLRKRPDQFEQPLILDLRRRTTSPSGT